MQFGMKSSIALLAVTVAAMVPSSADATGENWYMMMNCFPDSGFFADVTDYIHGPAGIENNSDEFHLFLVCSQPHFVGTDGYAASEARVRDRTTSDKVTVELCRNSGAASEMCVAVSTTNSNNSSFPYLLNFPAHTDSARSYYYWKVALPPSTGSTNSSLVSFRFNDS